MTLLLLNLNIFHMPFSSVFLVNFEQVTVCLVVRVSTASVQVHVLGAWGVFYQFLHPSSDKQPVVVVVL